MLEKLGIIQDKINELESQKQNTEMEYYQLGHDIGEFQRIIDLLKQEAWEIFKESFNIEE